VRVAEISSYLSATGWRELPQRWRGAAIWSRAGTEVLVPPRDDLGDIDLRIGELLRGLAEAEGRGVGEVAKAIITPQLDATTYRALPGADPAGFPSLLTGMRALRAIRKLLDTAARTVLEGPRTAFSGAPTGRVEQLLDAVRLTVDPHPDLALTLLLPLDPDGAPGLGRAVATQLYDAAGALHEAVEDDDDPAALDAAAAAGVSADFCAALSDLAGDGRRDPFQLDFRWAPAAPSELPARTLRFPAEAGVRIRQAARRLRQADLAGPTTVTGLVESLHDDEDGEQRRRILVRGELRTDRGSSGGRGVWVRLDDPDSYRTAVEAHRDRRPVRVRGFRGGPGTYPDLAVPPGGLEIRGPRDNP
jgi:hypothetical protein